MFEIIITFEKKGIYYFTAGKGKETKKGGGKKRKRIERENIIGGRGERAHDVFESMVTKTLSTVSFGNTKLTKTRFETRNV